MNAVKGRFQDSSGRFSIEGEPNREFAAELLHGEPYHVNKANIMQPIRDFQSMVDARTTGELEQVNASVFRLQQGIFLLPRGCSFVSVSWSGRFSKESSIVAMRWSLPPARSLKVT